MLHNKQGRLWVALLDGPTRHNATPGVWPILGTVLKFRDLPARIHRPIAQTSELALQRWDHARNHSVLGRRTRFQHVQQRSVTEARSEERRVGKADRVGGGQA